ncbi:MAG: HIRAN domain-containing protein [Xanthomonadales bacterium]|nr:HIRAN domain-containing protein [Xanthomonadales bacterium]
MDQQAQQLRQDAVTPAGPAPTRRRFLATLASALGGALTITLPPLRAHPMSRRLHLQDCRIAGSHYYDCDAVRARLLRGDPLRLRRQPDNRHDARATEVFWHEHNLGYLPRIDNAAAASLLDRAHPLHAEILGVDGPDEWEPVRLRVWV